MQRRHLGFGLGLILCLALAWLLADGVISAMSVRNKNAVNDQTPADKAELPGIIVDGVAQFVNIQNEPIGSALLQEGANGVLIILDVRNLPAGEHAIHIHETGLCEPVGSAQDMARQGKTGQEYFADAGDHFNPHNKEHGLLSSQGPHAGDLPNIYVASDGVLKATILNDRITLHEEADSSLGYLFDKDGAALIIHEGADDYQTPATGNSGSRIACAVITKNE